MGSTLAYDDGTGKDQVMQVCELITSCLIGRILSQMCTDGCFYLPLSNSGQSQATNKMGRQFMNEIQGYMRTTHTTRRRHLQHCILLNLVSPPFLSHWAVTPPTLSSPLFRNKAALLRSCRGILDLTSFLPTVQFF